MFLYLNMFSYYLKPYISFVKKAVVVFITLFIVLQLFFYFANKDKVVFTDPGVQANSIVYKTINDPELNKTAEGKQYIGFVSTLSCMLMGEGCNKDPKSPQNGFQHTFMGSLSSMLVMPMKYMPSSGIYWAQASLHDSGLISHANAAEGIGFAALSPFKALWLMFRNLVFFLMILIMIAIGFMIMFRTKLNAQTVISIENALPKIVIALILVTFSYAIAGFMIDLMYIIMGIIFALFKSGTVLGASGDVDTLQRAAYFNGSNALLGTIFDNKNNMWTIADSMYHVIPEELSGIVNSIVVSAFFQILVSAVGKAKLSAIVPGQTGLLPGQAPAQTLTLAGKILLALKAVSPITQVVDRLGDAKQMFLGIAIAIIQLIVYNVVTNSAIGVWLTTFLFYIVLSISAFFIFMRIFFMFLGVYIQILLLVIFSPVLLVFEAIPGRSIFSTWIKALFFNLATFPIFVLLLLVARAIMSINTDNPINASLWQPPFLGGVSAQAFKTLVAGILIFSSPELIKNFKQMMGYKPLPLSANFGSFFTGVAGVAGGAMGFMNQYQSLKGTLVGHSPGSNIFGESSDSAPRWVRSLFRVKDSKHP